MAFSVLMGECRGWQPGRERRVSGSSTVTGTMTMWSEYQTIGTALWSSFCCRELLLAAGTMTERDLAIACEWAQHQRHCHSCTSRYSSAVTVATGQRELLP